MDWQLAVMSDGLCDGLMAFMVPFVCLLLGLWALCWLSLREVD